MFGERGTWKAEVVDVPVEWRRWAVRGGVLAIATVAVAYVLAYTVPMPERLERRDSQVVTWRDGTAAHVFLSEDDRWRVTVDLDRVDADYTEALVALEDTRFWWHPGVDPIAVVRAAWSNATAGRVVSGGSTITMQLVRLLEPRPRTLWSKVVESLRAVQLELRLSKREILEQYLTYVPYGRNIEGIASASHLYFDKPPARLSADEIATLLAVPQDPNARYPTRDHREVLRRARDGIAERLADAGALPTGDGDDGIATDALVNQIREASVPGKLGAIPREIPHAAYWLRGDATDVRIRSTLDRNIQQTVEQLVDNRRTRLHGQGIYNASAVVVDHKDGAVRALVGNFDFDDHRHGGQIAGFAEARSTGSLLKPFIYASAIDAGEASPSHLAVDVPTSFNGYRPRNFGGTYYGLVELETALSQSLNIPFVELLAGVGLDPFLGRLKRLGVGEFTRPADEYGLSVAVGGMEMTPLEIASLYATLARDGELVDVHTRWREGGAAKAPRDHEFSEGATWLTRRALRERDRPDFPARKSSSDVPTGIHWKTGTSAHNRDAWSAGSGPRYTAVVWVGNFDNSRSPALVGSRAAGPMFFDILEALEERDGAEPPEPPASLIEVEVCAFSGHRPTDACPHTKEVLMPETSVATATCPYHVEREVDPKTGLALSPGCRAGRKHVTRSYRQIPARAARWMNERIGSLPPPPPYAPGCRPPGRGSGPVVEHPPPNRSLVLIPGMPADDQQVPLEADAATQGATLHWFVDGKFLGSAASDDRFWWTPEAGRHQIVVMDEAGQSDTREIVVRASR